MQESDCDNGHLNLELVNRKWKQKNSAEKSWEDQWMACLEELRNY